MEKIETRGGSRPGCGRKPVHPGIKRGQKTCSPGEKEVSNLYQCFSGDQEDD